jgi:hypothetical protein
MKTKCPYTFSARSRKSMTAYLLDRTDYAFHYHPFPFSWNVKVGMIDYLHPKGAELDASLDDKWEEHVKENSDSLWNWALEDAQRHYHEGEYSTWAGDDQGHWRFGFYGRSGGHICLESWLGRELNGRCFDLEEYVTSLSFSDLRTLYRAIVCMDHDFTRENATKEVEFHLNFQRTIWEDEQRSKQITQARELESERPDLYQNA